MPNNDVQTTEQTERQRHCVSYAFRSMVLYEDGSGGSDSNSNSGNGGGDSSSSGNGGSDIDEDCESWSKDGINSTGANGSSSSGSADEGCYSDDGEKSSTTRSGGSSSGSSSSGGSSSGGSSSGSSSSGGNSSGGSSSDGSGSDGGGGGNTPKWLISLYTVLDRVVGSQRKSRSKKRVVKTILRPPTTYMYVTGMSGLRSKVAVYPKPTSM